MSILTSAAKMVIPGWVKYALVVLIIAAVVGGSMKLGYTYGFNKAQVASQAAVIVQKDADLAAQKLIIADRAALQNKYNGLSSELQTTQSQLKEANSNVKVKLVTEIKSHTVYQSCIVPPSGVHIIFDQAQQFNSIRSGTATKP